MDEYTKQFGERVKARRKAMGLTQLGLALRMGFKSKQAISHIEAGDRNLKQSQVAALAAALNVTPAYLMGWEPDPSENTARRLMEYYLRLSEIDKAKLLGYAEGLLQKEE